jgi:DNA modification methylase
MQNNKHQNKGKYHKNNKLNDLTGSEWIQFTKSWFILKPKQRKDKEFIHPAKFPEELAERYISFFTKKEQIVLDPFAGISSTLLACEYLGRRGIGIEYIKKYADIGEKRLIKIKAQNNHIIINGDSQNLSKIWKIKKNKLPKYVDFIITSPPYWNMLDESRGNVLSTHKKRKKDGLDVKYSIKKNDLGNIEDYDLFLDALKKIFNQCYTLLKSGGYMVVVLQNLRVRDGHVCTLAWDLVRELKKKWYFVGEQIWLQDNKQLGIWGYPSVFVNNVHHHYCLIFYRNDITY